MRTHSRRRPARGQTATEYMLVISVIVIAAVGAAWVFVPSFEQGVGKLGQDVSQVLATGEVGGVGRGSSGGTMLTNGGTANSSVGTGDLGAPATPEN